MGACFWPFCGLIVGAADGSADTDVVSADRLITKRPYGAQKTTDPSRVSRF